MNFGTKLERTKGREFKGNDSHQNRKHQQPKGRLHSDSRWCHLLSTNKTKFPLYFCGFLSLTFRFQLSLIILKKRNLKNPKLGNRRIKKEMYFVRSGTQNGGRSNTTIKCEFL
jgi:hypothetical protein